MSERALAFVDEWISGHVHAQDAGGDIEARDKTLASQCLADASKKGIPVSEIGEAIDESGPARHLGQWVGAADARQHGGCPDRY